MRMSTLFAPTLREVPAEAETEAHRLMLRAGLMRKLAGGIYAYLPLGWRAIAKVAAIVRQEMDRQDAQEALTPLVQPAELWRESGRLDVYGEEMWRLHDRHGRPFVLGPTHEEVMTDLVRREVSSWRQLPFILYQVANKYRDELRPRFGVMRAREFIMKDAYSFDRDVDGMMASFQKMHEAYARYCTRCGLDWRAVEADSGAIGGHGLEFVSLAETGEADLVFCDGCGYAANVDKAEGAAPAAAPEPPAMHRLHTPGVRTIGELVAFADVSVTETAKILFYWAEHAGQPRELVAALVRGDRQLNEVKLLNAAGAVGLHMADRGEIREITGAPVGSAGPVGLAGARVFCDLEVAAGGGFAVGANQEDWHLLGAKAGRDFDPGVVADLRVVTAGDACPRCHAPLRAARGIEVGHIFALGTKYSEAMGASYLDEAAGQHLVQMGCYGIGVTRTVAAVIERHHDKDGIIWPYSVAPYHVSVVPVAAGEDGTAAAGRDLYGRLRSAGIEAVLDDRDERPGVKFKDADLLGFPLRVTVGRALADGKVELREREGGRTDLVPLDDAVEAIRLRIARGLAQTDPDARAAALAGQGDVAAAGVRHAGPVAPPKGDAGTAP